MLLLFFNLKTLQRLAPQSIVSTRTRQELCREFLGDFFREFTENRTVLGPEIIRPEDYTLKTAPGRAVPTAAGLQGAPIIFKETCWWLWILIEIIFCFSILILKKSADQIREERKWIVEHFWISDQLKSIFVILKHAQDPFRASYLMFHLKRTNKQV